MSAVLWVGRAPVGFAQLGTPQQQVTPCQALSACMHSYASKHADEVSVNAIRCKVPPSYSACAQCWNCCFPGLAECVPSHLQCLR